MGAFAKIGPVLAVMAVSLCLNLTLCLTSSQALEHPITTQGLVDLTGKEIIPCKYEWVQHGRDGLFCCYEKIKPGYVNGVWTRVYNSEGKELYRTKHGIVRIYILHEVPAGIVLQELPPDTVLAVTTPKGRSLLSLDGKELISPKKQGIKMVKAGEFIVFAPPGDFVDYAAELTVLIYDTVRKEIVSESWRKKEVCDAWIVSANATESGDKDTLIVHSKDPDGHALSYLLNVNGHLTSRLFQSVGTLQDGVRIVQMPGAPEHPLYGIIDSKFEFCVKPEYSEITYLGPNRFLAKTAKDSSYLVIDKSGNTIGELPKDTNKVEPGGAVSICHYYVGIGSERHNIIAVVNLDGKTLYSQENFGGGSCRDGTAVIVEPGGKEKEIAYTVVTADGVIARGVKGYKLEPTTDKRLIKSVFVKYPSENKNKLERAD
jgi:hypothetical protein